MSGFFDFNAQIDTDISSDVMTDTAKIAGDVRNVRNKSFYKRFFFWKSLIFIN